jgi:tRNA-(ms[2]io[6]A)-hydroxylase
MLGLLTPTDPSWVQAAGGDLDRLLSDHAHCELKAAQSALSLLGRFSGEAPELIGPLAALGREETAHFDLVASRIQQRGGVIGLPSNDDYVRALRAAASRDHHDGYPVLLDRLLVSALIEGRSCERFRLLSDGLPTLELRTFYRDLMASEAKHFTLFTELAKGRFGVDDVRSRFTTLATREAEVASRLPLGPQVHG